MPRLVKQRSIVCLMLIIWPKVYKVARQLSLSATTLKVVIGLMSLNGNLPNNGCRQVCFLVNNGKGG